MRKIKATGATRIVEKQPLQLRLPRVHIYWFAIPLLFAALFFSGRWVYLSWPVNTVEVNGQFSLWKPGLIVGQLEWLTDESFFSADLQQVFQQVDDLPLLNVVSVKKRWPDTILINVHEDVPMAIWNGEEILTVGGDILPRPGFVSGDKLARMRGNTHYAESVMRNYRRLHQMLKNSGVSVLELEVSDVGSITGKLSNGWSVAFGRQYFEERMKRLELLLKTLPHKDVAGIDLRYVKGAAIKWLPVGEMEA